MMAHLNHCILQDCFPQVVLCCFNRSWAFWQTKSQNKASGSQEYLLKETLIITYFHLVTSPVSILLNVKYKLIVAKEKKICENFSYLVAEF